MLRKLKLSKEPVCELEWGESGAILTGSCAYGTPTNDSDIDLVVLVNTWEMHELQKKADDQKVVGSHKEDYPSMCLYFGGLNLIVTDNPDLFRAWKEGTMELVCNRPVTREEAVKTLSKYRMKETE